MPVQWTSDLSVGVALIDDQHKELFKRVNQLLEATSHGKGKEEIGRIVQFLGEYVVTHFGTEEKAMIQHGYGGIATHKAEHLAFLKDFEDLAKSYQTQGTSTSLVLALQRRVVDWLINHIGKSDKALGTFLKSKQ
ncbi:MAG: bacteriohemerythrin [Sphingomonadaceae bacterium]